MDFNVFRMKMKKARMLFRHTDMHTPLMAYFLGENYRTNLSKQRPNAIRKLRLHKLQVLSVKFCLRQLKALLLLSCGIRSEKHHGAIYDNLWGLVP